MYLTSSTSLLWHSHWCDVFNSDLCRVVTETDNISLYISNKKISNKQISLAFRYRVHKKQVFPLCVNHKIKRWAIIISTCLATWRHKHYQLWKIMQTEASLCNDSLHCFFSWRSACCNWDGLALIKRHIATAAEWLQQLQSEVSVSVRIRKIHAWAWSSVSLSSSAVGHASSTVLNVHDASSVIAFGTSAPCHFSATNVTELWPNPDILYSAPSLIWLQWYHIWVDLIRGLQAQ